MPVSPLLQLCLKYLFCLIKEHTRSTLVLKDRCSLFPFLLMHWLVQGFLAMHVRSTRWTMERLFVLSPSVILPVMSTQEERYALDTGISNMVGFRINMKVMHQFESIMNVVYNINIKNGTILKMNNLTVNTLGSACTIWT